MIYSMTMFFNEYDLLDLKIKEESPYVDKIVIVESKWTHSGNPKPLNLPIDKYKDNDKIVYLAIDDENIYRDCKKDADGSFHSRADTERNYPLVKLPIADDDILIVVDVDEIINGENISRIVEETRKYGITRICMRLFYYYINVHSPGVWTHPYAIMGGIAKQANHLGLFRSWTGQAGFRIENCGSHFAWLGGAKAVEDKLISFSHTEFATPEIISGIKERFEKLEDAVGRSWMPKLEIINIDELHPKIMRENIGEWTKYILNKETHDGK